MGESTKKSILIIDDEQILLETYQDFFGGDYELHLYDNAQDGIKLLLSNAHIDTILCDIMMPNMTGIDFFNFILQMRPDLTKKITFLSSGTADSKVAAAISNSNIKLLYKPLRLGDLKKYIDSTTSAA